MCYSNSKIRDNSDYKQHWFAQQLLNKDAVNCILFINKEPLRTTTYSYSLYNIYDIQDICICCCVKCKRISMVTIFWADEIDTDLLSFGGLCHLNLLRPAPTLQQHQVPGKQTRGCLLKVNILHILEPVCNCFYIMVNAQCSNFVTQKLVGAWGLSFSREFLVEYHSVVRVSNDQRDIVVVGCCCPR